MRLKKIIKKIISISLASLFGVSLVFVVPATAAELFFDSRANEVGIGQEIEISLFLNTENKKINAIEGEIIIPSDFVELKEIRYGNSIISLWLEEPFLTESGLIRFAGIIPGGLNDANSYLLSLVIESDQVSENIFDLKNLNILLHDGKGTPTPVKYERYKLLTVSEQKVLPVINKIDKTKPEEFELTISRDIKIFNNDWFIIFAAQDKGVGIDYYLIQETRTGRLSDEKWIKSVSPYKLIDQSKKSYIFVKAIDKAGNELSKTIAPEYKIKWWEDWYNWVIIILGMILPLTVVYMLIRKIFKK